MITAELLSGFNRIAYEVMHYLLSVLWQSTILISAVGLLSFLLCRKNVKIRHGLLVGVMLIIPVLPLLSSLAGQSGVHRKEIAVLPAYSISPRQIIPPTTEPLRDKPQAQELLLSNTIIPAKAPAHEHISILDYPWLCVLLAYLVVAVYFLLKILSARVRIRHWIASGNAVIDEHTIDLFSGLKSQFRIMREVYIVESPCVTVPFTIRTFQPVILLPEGFAEQLSENELKATAIHELSHVKCNDALTATLISLIRTFFFFHPLIWIAAKQISYLAELVCDNAVMELSSDSASYAGLLSRIAENIPRRLPTEYAAGIIFSGSVFYRRMKVLLSEKGIQIQRLSRLALTGTAVGIFLSLAIALAVPLAEKGTQSMITISGKVIVDDKPVAGAKIFVFYQSERKFEQKSVTDKNGMFTVSISESLLTGERWNRLAIIARHDKYSFGWKYLTDEEKNDTISINLFKPETITGTIKDESGNPIKNADINVLHIGYSSGMDVFDTNLLFLGGKYNEFGTGTDQNGNFTLDMVPEGSTVALYCVAPGFAYVWKSPVTAGTEGIPIVLKPEGRIEGSVVSSLPDISVKNISIGAQGILYSWWGETTTDENGTYILKNLPEDYYNVFVLDDLPDCTAAAQESVKVGPGTTIKNVDLILIEGGFITGKIIDTETGQGFITDEHADVAIYGPSRPKSGAAVQTSKIQPDGSYKIRAAPGKNYIYKMQLGFPWTLEDIQGDNYHWVDVKNGETISEVNFYVKKDKEKKVTVKVTTPDGSPAKNILIQSLSEGGFIEFPSLGRTDKDGIVEINRFRVKMNKTIMAVDTDKKLRGFLKIEYPVTENRIEITVKSYDTVSIKGKVIDSEGKPLLGVFIILSEKISGSATAVTITGNNGEFEISGLIDGDEYGVGASYDQERFEMQKHFTAEKNKRTLDDIVLKVSNKKADDLQSDSDNSSEVNRNDDQQSSLYETSVKTLYTLTVANLQGVGISEHHAETLSEDLRSNISRMLAKSVRSDAQYEYVDYDRSEENPADIIIIGTAGSTGNTCYVFARLVHVETGRIVACLKRYQEDFFDTIIADISADVRNVLFDATWVESAVLAVPYGAEQICYTLCAFDLDPNNIDTSEAEIISEKLRTEVYQIVLSSDYKNKNLREKFIPVERSQIKKIIDHVLIDRADSSAIEYGKLQQLDNIIIGSISKTGDTYSVIARNIDVESSKTVHETECEHRGSVEEILDELIPEVAHDLVYGK